VLTVVRAQESTTARAYSTGDRIEIRITAQTFLDATLIPDGDKGDITTSSSGTVWTIDNNAITETKVANAAITAAKLATGAARTNFGAGAVLQVVSTTKVDTFSTTSSSYVDVTGLNVSITPSSASSKILITGLVNFGAYQDVGFFRLVRNSTAICVGTAAGSRVAATAQMRNSPDAADADAAALNFLDSPNTTSSVTYKIQAANSPGGYTTRINSSADDVDQTNRGRTASTITVMEIAG
jgi:hypothetical protein